MRGVGRPKNSGLPHFSKESIEIFKKSEFIMGKYLKIGDIFEINLGNGTTGYVQYIADDMTQLNSRVIRVFKNRHPADSAPTIDKIISDDVDFYVHVYDIKEREKDGTIIKIGKSQNVGDIKKILFRGESSMLTIHSPSPISKHWYVWKIGEETTDVRPHSKLLPQSHHGSVMPIDAVIERMKTGKYEGFFPKYEGEE